MLDTSVAKKNFFNIQYNSHPYILTKGEVIKMPNARDMPSPLLTIAAHAIINQRNFLFKIIPNKKGRRDLAQA